jgi:hypothetical protein
MRGSDEATIAVFDNNEAFQADLNQLIEEAKDKREAANEEYEQMTLDLD